MTNKDSNNDTAERSLQEDQLTHGESNGTDSSNNQQTHSANEFISSTASCECDTTPSTTTGHHKSNGHDDNEPRCGSSCNPTHHHTCSHTNLSTHGATPISTRGTSTEMQQFGGWVTADRCGGERSWGGRARPGCGRGGPQVPMPYVGDNQLIPYASGGTQQGQQQPLSMWYSNKTKYFVN